MFSFIVKCKLYHFFTLLRGTMTLKQIKALIHICTVLYILNSLSIITFADSIENNVNIPDPNLKAAIINQLNIKEGTITKLDMEKLTYLNANSQEISDLTGLEYATNLNTLILINNLITDISVLEHLTNLKFLELNSNKIKSLTPLKSLTQLNFLSLSDTMTIDISELGDLENLYYLYLGNNYITDLSDLQGLNKLISLDLQNNLVQDIEKLPATVQHQLETLNLAGNKIENINLSNFKNLEALLIANNRIKTIEVLSDLTNLKILDISYNPIKEISPLNNLINLEYLMLNSVEDNKFNKLTEVTKLLYLSANNNRLTNIEFILNSPNLISLSLQNNTIMDINPLLSFESLKELRIDGNMLGQNNPVIEELESRGVEVYGAEYQHEWKPTFKNIQFSKSEISVGETLTIEAELYDSDKIIQDIELIISMPSMNITSDVERVHLVYDVLKNKWIGNLKISKKHLNGEWILNSAYMYNEEEYYYTQLHETFKVINPHLKAAITSIESVDKRENMGMRIFLSDITLIPIEDTTGTIIISPLSNSEELTIEHLEIFEEFGVYTLKFNIPTDISEGKWEIKEMELVVGDNKYSYSNFYMDTYAPDYFYVPSVETDNFVRSTFTIENSSIKGIGYPINRFIEHFQKALPPNKDKILYENLLVYADKTGNPRGDEARLYKWYLDGIIGSEITPPVPIQVYSSTYELLDNTRFYVTEMLHVLSNMHNESNTIVAYLVAPNGKEYMVEDFQYDSNFQDIGMLSKGGWVSEFILPEDAVNGIWIIDRVELYDNNMRQIFKNGVDFYAENLFVNNGFDIPEHDNVVTPPSEKNPGNTPTVTPIEQTEGIEKDELGNKFVLKEDFLRRNNPSSNPEVIKIDFSSLQNHVERLEIPYETFIYIQETQKAVAIEIVSNGNVMNIPFDEIDLDKLTKDYNIPKKDITINFYIKQAEDVNNVLAKNQLVPKSAIIDFGINININGEYVELTHYNKHIKRTIKGNSTINKEIATVIRLNNDGTFTPVPTIFNQNDAIFKSMSNSLYVITQNEVTFQDLELTHWASNYINKLGSKFIIRGYDSGEIYRPEKALTRIQLAALITRSFGLSTNEKYNGSFKDIEGSEWFIEDLLPVWEFGIIKGYEDNTFRPNAPVTRQEAAVMLTRASKFVDDEPYPGVGNMDKFTDYNEIEGWAYESFKLIVNKGIIEGFPDGSLQPRKTITRAEIAKVLNSTLVSVGLLE